MANRRKPKKAQPQPKNTRPRRNEPRTPHRRQHRPNQRLVSWLIAQVPEFCLSGPGPLGRALGMLREQLGNARDLAARLEA